MIGFVTWLPSVLSNVCTKRWLSDKTIMYVFLRITFHALYEHSSTVKLQSFNGNPNSNFLWVKLDYYIETLKLVLKQLPG